MSIFPQNPKSNSIKITSVSPTLISLTHSLKRQVRRRGGQRWLLDISYPPMTREQFAPIWAFSIAQQGQFNTFEYIPYPYSNTSGTGTGTLLSSGIYNAGDNVITATGLTGTLKAGDFIKFEGHSKVYMLTLDGSTTLNIEPALVKGVSDAEVIVYNDVPFNVAFTRDTTDMRVRVNALISYRINLAEIV